MNLLSTITAKIILGLGLALLLSLGGNFLLIRHMWIEAGEAKGRDERASLQARVDSFEKAKAVSDALGKVAQDNHAALVTELEAIAASSRSNQSRSRTVTRANPLPAVCKPGQARMDSVNKTLGPRTR